MKKIAGDMAEAGKTKDRIILEAAILFAHRGYADVSMRDIAQTVGIRPSAIYNHFEKKETLFENILENITDIYLSYFTRLQKKMDKATCYADVIDGLFAELLEIYQIYVYYGISLITIEQFRDERARNTFNKSIMGVGIDYSRMMFDECIRRKWVKAFDTTALATLFMNSVLVGTLMRTHENMGHEMAYDPQTMFLGLKQHMLQSVELIDK